MLSTNLSFLKEEIMSFWLSKVLIRVSLFCAIVAPSAFSSTGIFDAENYRFSYSSKGSSTFVLTNETLRSLACRSPKKSRFASKAKALSPKKKGVRDLTHQATIESYWITSESECPQKTSINTMTFDEGNKENVLPSSPQTNNEEDKKAELKKKNAEFMALLRQPSKVDHEGLKKKFLKKVWPISENGNPYLQISSLESPDGKSHYIVIIKSVSQYTGITEYSAYIDGQSYSKFQPLGHAWFPDHDSVKRASLTIIYK